MTHPFHPLRGQRFEFVDCRSCWGQQRVYYYAGSRQLAYIPAAWTDLAEPDPFVIASQGRAIASADDLLRLADLVRGLTAKEITPKV